MKGNGSTPIARDYYFVDNKIAKEGIYYYRLNQVDNNGSSTYSTVLSVEMASAKVKVYPTFINNRVNILSANDQLPVTVIDMTGRVLREFTTTPNSVDVSDFGAGVYIVRVGMKLRGL